MQTMSKIFDEAYSHPLPTIKVAWKCYILKWSWFIKEESFNKYTLLDEAVKQADVVLMGFPLMINMDESTRRNDLRIYEAVSSKETIL